MKNSVYIPEIRFSDIDVMGHVNNATYLTYFEQARVHFFNQLVGEWDWEKYGILLARNEVNYRKPILYKDKVQIHTHITKIGGKSLELEYRITKPGNDGEELCTDGKSVLVCFDYHKQKTIPVPQSWKDKLT
jgi:acyl-CoA thioester hydrolase